MGVAARTVRTADGREWHVRVYGFRPPRWRRFQPLFEESVEIGPLLPFEALLAVVSAVLTALVLPLLALLVDTPAAVLRTVFTDTRWVEATGAGLRRSQLTWRTDAAHAGAVADQVARQLQLGYDRVQPHNAVFEGFADP